MRILIVGNDPNDIGGVTNYTRPLSLEFAKLGHSVFYFYSGASNRKYDFRLFPYLRRDIFAAAFKTAELINSPCFSVNFGFPELELEEAQTERIFKAYLHEVQPDVMHVHSRMGLPVSIFRIAKAHGIKVFNTIHVYGMLCQKRVMIDSAGAPCEGPVDLQACARCTGKSNLHLLKLRARIERVSPRLATQLTKAWVNMQAGKGAKGASKDAPPPDVALARGIEKRLAGMVKTLNQAVDCTLCVSTDVKKTLMKFGVMPEKLLVQHIGSVIAESQKDNNRPISRPLVIGNIGGVTYYKGTHILVDAVEKIQGADFVVKIFGRFKKEFVENICAGKKNMKIEFLGSYHPDDLPHILEQIDVMVLPSICKDTAPQTIFESYSARMPIIASRIGGFPDFVVDNVNGILFRAGDRDNLAAKLSYVLQNPEVLLRYRQQIPKLKTIRENALELLELYRDQGGQNVQIQSTSSFK